MHKDLYARFKWRKRFLQGGLALLVLFCWTSVCQAAPVTVKLPDFPIKLNNTVIYNDTRQYPLIVYKNITYFPMTYYDCRFLGLETQWNAQTGLAIQQSDLSGAYRPGNNTRNRKQDTARMPDFAITINGKPLHNGQEAYPLLVYRDVTYFPLTWQFAVNEFGWEYSFDPKQGLSITSSNLHTITETIADARTDLIWQEDGTTTTGYAHFTLTADDTYLYYMAEKGQIRRAPLGQLKQSAQVYQLPENSYTGTYCFGNLYQENGRRYLWYHSGGAVMGSDVVIELHADGSTTERLHYYGTYKDFNDFSVIINHQVPPFAYPLLLTRPNGSSGMVGEEYFYQDDFDYWGGNIYTRATQKYDEAASLIYAMDPQSGKLTAVSKHPSKGFVLQDGTIYYTSTWKDGKDAGANSAWDFLYQLDLAAGKETYLGTIDKSEPNLLACQRGLFYLNPGKQLIFYEKQTQKKQAVNQEGNLVMLREENGYVMAFFDETPSNPNRLMVFDGKTAPQAGYITADKAGWASVSNKGLLVYTLDGTNQIVRVMLK